MDITKNDKEVINLGKGSLPTSARIGQKPKYILPDVRIFYRTAKSLCKPNRDMSIFLCIKMKRKWRNRDYKGSKVTYLNLYTNDKNTNWYK